MNFCCLETRFHFAVTKLTSSSTVQIVPDFARKLKYNFNNLSVLAMSLSTLALLLLTASASASSSFVASDAISLLSSSLVVSLACSYICLLLLVSDTHTLLAVLSNSFRKLLTTDTVDLAVLKSMAPYIRITQKPPLTMADLELASVPSKSVISYLQHATANSMLKHHSI